MIASWGPGAQTANVNNSGCLWTSVLEALLDSGAIIKQGNFTRWCLFRGGVATSLVFHHYLGDLEGYGPGTFVYNPSPAQKCIPHANFKVVRLLTNGFNGHFCIWQIAINASGLRIQTTKIGQNATFSQHATNQQMLFILFYYAF